jgi:hypothetical protein
MPKPTMRKSQKFRPKAYRPLDTVGLMRRVSRLQKALALRAQREKRKKQNNKKACGTKLK